MSTQIVLSHAELDHKHEVEIAPHLRQFMEDQVVRGTPQKLGIVKKVHVLVFRVIILTCKRGKDIFYNAKSCHYHH